jgi:hypothetical protein
MIDKNKLKEKIQKTPSKDILYLTVNPVESKSLQTVMKEIEKFVGKDEIEFIVIRK